MSLTNSAARARVQSLYGTAVAGHLHAADRLTIAKFHSDAKEYVRFQPLDESLPRFRIPMSEFPETNWLHKKMKSKWKSEVTVEPDDWPPEKKLPSAKFSPPLATQFHISNGITKTENIDHSDAAMDQLESPHAVLNRHMNDELQKPSKKKKKKQRSPENEEAMQSEDELTHIVQQGIPKGNTYLKQLVRPNDPEMTPEESLPEAVLASSNRSKRTPRRTNHTLLRNETNERLGPLQQSNDGLNRKLVQAHDVSSPDVGRPRRPNHHRVISRNETVHDDSNVKLASSEDESRQQKPDAPTPLIPRGSYVCRLCNVPGHFIEDCPSITPKTPKTYRNVRALDSGNSKDAVSEAKVRFRRRRSEHPDHSVSDTPIRSLDFRRRRPQDSTGSETETPNDRSKFYLRPKTRKAIYKEYLADEAVATGLADGSLIKGVLHVNAKRSTEAYVRRSDTDGGRDIKIVGHLHRNRAYDGDTVIVRILPNDETSEEKEISDLDLVEESEQILLADESVAMVATAPTTLDDITAKLDAVVLSEETAAEEEDRPRPLGEVVAVSSRAKDVTVDIIGYLKLLIPSANVKEDADDDTVKTARLAAPVAPISPEPSNVIMFQPISKRIPRGFLQNSLWPTDLKSSDPELVKMAWSSIYSASYRPWKIHEKSPRVATLDLIGSAGHIEPETKALLRATKISHSEVFDAEALECLREFGYDPVSKSVQKWTIPADVLAERRDYRKARVFTIDPSTAKDLDDALSINKITDDIFEIGVHIADVSYFLKEDTPLDLEARKRCTSVYLVQKVIPMLPPLLCEELCSLNPGVDRLAFSVVWRMNRNGHICSEPSPWFGRTIIRSCAKLDYRTAQRIVDGESDIEIDIHDDHTFQQIADDCKHMMEIAMARRAHRFENGSLKLDRPKMHFQFDDMFSPVSVAAYELHDTNRMIEEYMLLANMLVAEKLVNDIPSVALLRRHVPPVLGKLNEILEVCSRLGYKIDGQSSKALHQTLMQIEEEQIRSFISVLLTVAMRRAEYLCINGMCRDPNEVPEEEGFAHYALGFETYTHFTSPIRRYADVIVHRMLEHCLARESDPSKIKKLPDPEEISKMAERCNEMKNRAKNAQDMSLLMYLAVLVKKQALVEIAYIMDLGVKAFCVYVPRLGLEDRIMIEKIPNIKKAEIRKNPDSDLKTLFLEWEDGRTEQCGMFESVRVQVGVSAAVPYVAQLTVLPKTSTEESYD